MLWSKKHIIKVNAKGVERDGLLEIKTNKGTFTMKGKEFDIMLGAFIGYMKIQSEAIEKGVMVTIKEHKIMNRI